MVTGLQTSRRHHHHHHHHHHNRHQHYYVTTMITISIILLVVVIIIQNVLILVAIISLIVIIIISTAPTTIIIITSFESLIYWFVEYMDSYYKKITIRFGLKCLQWFLSLLLQFQLITTQQYQFQIHHFKAMPKAYRKSWITQYILTEFLFDKPTLIWMPVHTVTGAMAYRCTWTKYNYNLTRVIFKPPATKRITKPLWVLPSLRLLNCLCYS